MRIQTCHPFSFCHKIPGDNMSPTIMIAVRVFLCYIFYVATSLTHKRIVCLCPVTIQFFGYQ